MHSNRRDKSKWFEKFLFYIIPFLVETLVQDGIHSIKDFPQHPVAEYLKNKIPGYEAWVVEARQSVENICSQCRNDEICALNADLQAIVGSLHEQVLALKREVKSSDKKVDSLSRQLQKMYTVQISVQLGVTQCLAAISNQVGALHTMFVDQQQQHHLQPQPLAEKGQRQQHQNNNNHNNNGNNPPLLREQGIDGGDGILEDMEEEDKIGREVWWLWPSKMIDGLQATC
jgi:hypothetical protein